MDDPRVGSVLAGRYRIDSRLAAGGAGVVYRATQLGLGRAVAIKFLHQSSAGSPTQRGRFEREARVMSQLAHPAIASVIDFGLDDHVPYLVLEFCRGRSLRALIAEHTIGPRRATHVAMQILKGLSHAHDAQIVHRDLKPANVLVDTPLGEDEIKILDFGVAKITSSDGPTEISVAAGGPLGTPHYMSPEQAMMKPVDARSDIYALGVILYEMVTGVRPFDSGTGYALLRQHVEDKPRPPRKLTKISTQLDRVILRALAKSPTDRFQSAAEMMEALDRVPEMRDPSRRGRRALRSSLGLVTLGALAGGGWYGAELGYYELPWRLSQDTAPAPLAGSKLADAEDPESTLDSEEPAAAENRVVDPIPTWLPAPANVELGEAMEFPEISNDSLAGQIAGQSFQPRFAIVTPNGGHAQLRLTAEIPPGRECFGLDDSTLGTMLSLNLPIRISDGEALRDTQGDGATLRANGRETQLESSWHLRFEEVDAARRSLKAHFEFQGRRTRLSGKFVAAYCPEVLTRNPLLPVVNGVVWDLEHVPAFERLPQRSVAAVLGNASFEPARVQVNSVGAPPRATLTFFADVAAEPCAPIAPGEVGVYVSFPGDDITNYARADLLAEDPMQTPWATFQYGSACSDCSQQRAEAASALALHIDASYDGEIRGRVYAAAKGESHSMLAGAFRATDCRGSSLATNVEVGTAEDAGPEALRDTAEAATTKP